MPAHAAVAPTNSIATAAAGAEQRIRLNIHPLLVLLGSLAETLPKQALLVLAVRLRRRAPVPKAP